LFVRQVAILSSGTALAQMIALGFLPFLTRLYSPQEFGAFALYMAIASPLFILGNSGFKELIMLPHSNKIAAQFVQLTFLISILVSSIVLFVTLVFDTQISNIIVGKTNGDADFTFLLYFLPFSILFFVNYQSFRFWFMRFERYGIISSGQVAKTTTNMLSAISIKIAKTTQLAGAGLVFAAILAELINLVWLLIRCGKKDRILFEQIKPKRLIVIVIRYKKMATSLTVSQLIAALYTQLPNFIISAFFGLTTLGLYNIAERIASAPALLIANGVGDVYRQRAAVQYRENGRFEKLMFKTMLTTTAIAIIPYSIGILFAPEIFSFVLGLEWEQAGKYASIILVGSFFGFITTPVDKAAVIVKAHKFILLFNVLRLVLHTIAALLVMLNILDLMSYIIALTAIRIMVYAIMTIRSWHYARGAKQS